MPLPTGPRNGTTVHPGKLDSSASDNLLIPNRTQDRNLLIKTISKLLSVGLSLKRFPNLLNFIDF